MQKSDRGYLSLFSRKKLIFAQKNGKNEKNSVPCTLMPFSLLRPFLSIRFSLFPGVALWRVLSYFSARLVAAASPPLFSVLLPAQQVQLFSFLAEKKTKKNQKVF